MAGRGLRSRGSGSRGCGQQRGQETQPGYASSSQEAPSLAWVGCGQRAAVWDARCHKPDMVSKGRG